MWVLHLHWANHCLVVSDKIVTVSGCIFSNKMLICLSSFDELCASWWRSDLAWKCFSVCIAASIKLYPSAVVVSETQLPMHNVMAKYIYKWLSLLEWVTKVNWSLPCNEFNKSCSLSLAVHHRRVWVLVAGGTVGSCNGVWRVNVPPFLRYSPHLPHSLPLQPAYIFFYQVIAPKCFWTHLQILQSNCYIVEQPNHILWQLY